MAEVVGRSYRRIDTQPAGLRLVDKVVTPPIGGTAKVVVRVECVGVCDSDIKELQGRRPVRRDFGHEVFGRIVWSEPKVRAVGTPVVLDPHIPLPLRTTGFAEYMEMEGSQGELRQALVPVAANLPRTAGIFVEPLSCASHCVARLAELSRRSGSGDTPVAVYGAGLAGTLIASLLNRAGSIVRLTNRTAPRLQFLRSRGVLVDALTAEQEFLSGRHQRIIVATSVLTPALWRKVTSVLADGGLLLVFAGTTPGLRLDGLDVDQVRRRELVAGLDSGRSVGGSYGATPMDFADSLRHLTADGGSLTWLLERLIAERVSLDRAVPTLTDLLRRDRPGKIVVDVRP